MTKKECIQKLKEMGVTEIQGEYPNSFRMINHEFQVENDEKVLSYFNNGGITYYSTGKVNQMGIWYNYEDSIDLIKQIINIYLE